VSLHHKACIGGTKARRYSASPQEKDSIDVLFISPLRALDTYPRQAAFWPDPVGNIAIAGTSGGDGGVTAAVRRPATPGKPVALARFALTLGAESYSRERRRMG